MSRDPVVTVVIPTYQASALLERCLGALERQTLAAPRFDIVVVDDGSTDGTAVLLESWAARAPGRRVVSQPNQGPVRARNAGIAECRTALVAFTDSDCEPAPGWLKAALDALDRCPEAVAIEGRTATDRDRTGPFTHQVENLTGGYFATCNMVYRRWVIEAVNGFDTDFHYGHEDTDLAIRAKAHGPIPFDAEVLVSHPPVEVPFWKLVKRPMVWTCQIVLYAKHPRLYVEGHGRGPFGVLLWHYGVVQLVQRARDNSSRFTKDPALAVKWLLAMALQRAYLLLCFPHYWRRLRQLTTARSPS